MAEHANAEVVRKLTEAFATGDATQVEAIADPLIADDVVWHEIGRAEPRRGKGELAASMGEFQGYDIKWDIHDVVASDDHVVALGTATVTHGDRKIVYRTAEIYHVRNGQVAERWAFSDDTKAITDFFA